MIFLGILVLAVMTIGAVDGESQKRLAHFPIYDEFRHGCPAECNLECRYGRPEYRHISFNFSCQSQSAHPHFRLDNQILPLHGDSSIAIGGKQLSIYHPLPKHQGVYRCFDADQPDHSKLVATNCTCLYVWGTDPQHKMCYPVPVIYPGLTDAEKIAKQNVVARVGESVTFACPHAKPWTSSSSYAHWVFNHSRVMHRYDAHHKFTIRSVDFTDQGFYTCEIVQSLYYVKNATMIFKLTVLGPLPKQMPPLTKSEQTVVTWQTPSAEDLHGEAVMGFKLTLRYASWDRVLERIHQLGPETTYEDVPTMLSMCEACSLDGHLTVTIQVETAWGFSIPSEPVTFNWRRTLPRYHMLQFSLESVEVCPKKLFPNGTVRFSRLKRDVFSTLSLLVKRSCSCCDVSDLVVMGSCSNGDRKPRCSGGGSLRIQVLLRISTSVRHPDLLGAMSGAVAATGTTITFPKLWAMDVIKICELLPTATSHKCRNFHVPASFFFHPNCRISNFDASGVL